MNTRFRFHRLMRPDDGGVGGAAGAPPAAPPAGSPPAPAPAPPGIGWLPGVDETTVGYVQNKGWNNAGDMLTGYRNLETVLGADRAGRTIVLPKDDQDVTTREAMWTKLGWSKDAGAYKLPVPEGADPKFAGDMAGLFSKHGIPVASAQAFVNDWNAYVTARTTADGEAAAAAFQNESAQLDRDWGAERAARTELARRAAQQLGVKPETVAALEKAGGFAETMKLFAKVADMMKEHGAEGLSTPGSLGMTPEGAKAKKVQLMADAAWRAKAMVNGSAEFAELTRLNQVITGATA